jgi:tRNA(Ile)-lysidine synthase
MKKADFISKANKTIDYYNLIKPKDRIIVAVSGGPDSVALLFTLLELKKELNLSLFVAHINHKLRGKESDKDQEFVRKLTSDLKLRFYTRSFQVKKEAKKLKLSVEECAREIRYDYLNKLAGKLKAQKIALGHNFNDQAETVLLRLIRGSGSLGLSGISPVKGRIIRPLIEIKREEIETFLKQKKIPFRIDSSNLRTDYLRNKVRLKLLPILRKEYNPKIEEVLNRTAFILMSEERYISQKAEKAYPKVILREQNNKVILDSRSFSDYDDSVKRFIIRNCVKKLKGDLMELNFDKVESLLNLMQQGKSGKRVDLLADIYGDITKDHISIYKRKTKEFNYTLSLPAKRELKELKVSIDSEILSSPSKRNIKNKDNWTVFLDMNRLKPPLRLRNRKNGDRFRPLGMRGTKSVADFLVDLKVPRCDRDEVMLLTSRNKIVWLVGYRISEDFKVTTKTEKVLKIKIEKK